MRRLKKTRDIDSEILKKLIVAGSPVAKAVALTILDKRTGGKVAEVPRRILGRSEKKICYCAYSVFRSDFWQRLR